MRRRAIFRRRLVALVLTAGATAAVWLVLVRDDGTGTGDPANATPAVSGPVGSLLERMSAEEKLDQILLAGFDGTEADRVEPAPSGEGVPGAYLVSATNWLDPAQGTELTTRLRKLATAGNGVEPLIVADQEGGPYRTLAGLPPRRREIEVGDSGDPALAERWARAVGKALGEVGIDLNLGPIADVASLDSPIADRSFSDHAPTAAAMTAAAAQGCAQTPTACAVAHFPGLGAANQDPAIGPAIVSLDLVGLRERDLLPFAAAIEQGIPAVVVANASYAAFDSVTPASLSPEVLVGLLREDLGFAGVAVTDDLSAGAIDAYSSPPRAAVEAVAAGADLVQIADPADVAATRAALLEAVATGVIDERRLDQAAARVLELKHSLDLLGAG